MAALSLFEHRVPPVWLPPYYSDINPLERFWQHLKDLACANKLQDKMGDVATSAEKVLKCSVANINCWMKKTIWELEEGRALEHKAGD